MIKKILVCTLSLFILILPALRADEGMWLPLLLKKLNEGDMQKKGLKLTADDIYNINQSSLKDAIVHFGGFCTGEMVSADGLILTNHHCGFDAVQSHSSVEKDYITNGFWAMSRDQELSNPGLFVRFLVSIEDVTEKVMAALPADVTEHRASRNCKRSLRNFRKKPKANRIMR